MIPLGIGGLTNLRTLSKVIIGGAGEFKISDLKGLLHLEGDLSIEGLDKVNDAVQAKEANLQQKEGLRDLELKWGEVFDDSQNEIREYEVLKGLRPFEKLITLEILYYKGTKFPIWVGHPSFDCLTYLVLRGCTSLPTLGHLPSLQKLFIGCMDVLEKLGSEFLTPPNSCDGVAFPSLEVLEFRDMPNWVEWSIGEAFPCLRQISLINCPKLDVVAIDLMLSLRVCHIQGCSVAVLTSLVHTSSSTIHLTLRGITGLTQLCGEVLKHLQALEYLCISECDELEYLWESEVEAWEILVSLQKLKVKSCRNLVSLGEKMVDVAISMESLKEVEISDCPRFKRYNRLNHVEKLRIYSCGSISSPTFPTLKDVDIGWCDNLEMSWLLNNIFLSALESLRITEVSNLRLFPEGCYSHLTRLIVFGCENIESIPGNVLICLRSLEIKSCKNLKSFSQEHLQSLTSLEFMWIANCPNLDDSFPCGKWPPKLSTLAIGHLKKPISEWGMQNFPPSLVELVLDGETSGVVRFAKAEEDMTRNTATSLSSFLLPSSLTCLGIKNFKELESVSEGMQHLTCLEGLYIRSCQKLRDLPKTLLPSLSSLVVESPSPELKKKCEDRKGKYWPVISQIPELEINEDLTEGFTGR